MPDETTGPREVTFHLLHGPHGWRGYLVAVGCAALIVVARLALLPILPHGYPFITLFLGVSYLAVKQKGVETPPEGFAGGIDTWHYHSDLCFVGKDVTVARADDCKRKNGLYQPETPWMMHAWLFKENAWKRLGKDFDRH